MFQLFSAPLYEQIFKKAKNLFKKNLIDFDKLFDCLFILFFALIENVKCTQFTITVDVLDFRSDPLIICEQKTTAQFEKEKLFKSNELSEYPYIGLCDLFFF